VNRANHWVINSLNELSERQPKEPICHECGYCLGFNITSDSKLLRPLIPEIKSEEFDSGAILTTEEVSQWRERITLIKNIVREKDVLEKYNIEIN
jgi:hypothetical protein